MFKMKFMMLLLCILLTACSSNATDIEEYEYLCNKQWYSRMGEIYFNENGEGIYRSIYYAIDMYSDDPDKKAERYSRLVSFSWEMTEDRSIILESDDKNKVYFYEDGTYIWEDEWKVEKSSLTINGDVYSNTPID